MSAMRSSPAGSRSSSDHRLEPLDVGPRRLLDGRRPSRAAVRSCCGLVRELAGGEADAEMLAERLEQGDRGRGVRAGDVVGDLGEVAERRDAGAAPPRSRAPRRAPTGRAACPPGRPMTSPRSRPGADSVPRIGTGRVCGTAAGIAPRLIHSATPRRPARSTRVGHELAPAVVGLRARRGPGGRDRRGGPGGRPARARSAPRAGRRRSRAAVGGRGSRRARSASKVATTGASSASCSSAVVAADPASTQPSKAATKVGATRSPGSSRR